MCRRMGSWFLDLTKMAGQLSQESGDVLQQGFERIGCQPEDGIRYLAGLDFMAREFTNLHFLDIPECAP
jgi:hypothetical protein